jgi:hypothetical protein
MQRKTMKEVCVDDQNCKKLNPKHFEEYCKKKILNSSTSKKIPKWTSF